MEQKEAGLSLFTEAHNILERLSVLDDLKREIETQKKVVRDKEVIIRQLIENEAREREQIDTILMRMREDIKILSSTLMLQTTKEEPKPDQNAEPEPKQTQTPEAKLSTGQSKSEPEPDEPEGTTFTFSDRLWLIGQDVKRFLGKKIL